MPNKQKSSKAGRQSKSPQNSKYKNEKRQEQNKLLRLQKHIKAHGVTGKDALEAIRRLEIVLRGAPVTSLPVNQKKRSAASAAFYRLPDAEERRRKMKTFGVTPQKAA